MNDALFQHIQSTFAKPEATIFRWRWDRSHLLSREYNQLAVMGDRQNHAAHDVQRWGIVKIPLSNVVYLGGHVDHVATQWEGNKAVPSLSVTACQGNADGHQDVVAAST